MLLDPIDDTSPTIGIIEKYIEYDNRITSTQVKSSLFTILSIVLKIANKEKKPNIFISIY